MGTQVEERFSDFFESWVSELEDLVKHLLYASTGGGGGSGSGGMMEVQQEPHLRSLVSKLTAHIKLYYTVKWAHAHQDVLAFFSPSWVTPLEAAYSWVTGWKPSMAFRLILPSALSPDQLLKLEQLRVKIKAQEDRVDRDMERQQMALADHHMVQLSRLETRRRNGDPMPAVVGKVEGLVDAAIKGMLLGLERTMKAADCVRLKTMKGILEVLTPLQCVRFLASISLIQIRLRQWGQPKRLPKIPPTKQ
ncbi:protein DOG1-like 4 [Cucurbita pepo subsp. pepo]|uniref:protein DOG1-like 4 n=1 Tax=Cucurbita pepo subsp. pepo TaxID=3664 RepID=UPI000C9D7DCF|nr:protein DOG1-like 4 [Cucurbita pepo subsp. pepo]